MTSEVARPLAQGSLAHVPCGSDAGILWPHGMIVNDSVLWTLQLKSSAFYMAYGFELALAIARSMVV
jgi:hypothetical protein